ncbi:MAG: type II secretion system protein [Patescibacteria group bacterium]
MISTHFRKDKGFTLIELLIAISLVGILGGLVVGMINYGGVRTKMRDNTRIADLGLIQNALEQYFTDHRHYPPQGTWSADLLPEYVNELPVDPQTGAAYTYLSINSGSYYALAASMEKASSSVGHECANLDAYTSLVAEGDLFPGGNCYGVESPTVLIIN